MSVFDFTDERVRDIRTPVISKESINIKVVVSNDIEESTTLKFCIFNIDKQEFISTIADYMLVIKIEDIKSGISTENKIIGCLSIKSEQSAYIGTTCPEPGIHNGIFTISFPYLKGNNILVFSK